MFFLNYYIGKYFYSYFLYYFPFKRRFMYNFQYFLLPAFSIIMLNSMQNFEKVNLHKEIKSDSLYFIYLWYHLNFKTENLNQHNINFLDNYINAKWFYLSRHSISYFDVKKILYYHYLKCEYLKMILAKEAISLSNANNNSEIITQMNTFKNGLYLDKILDILKNFMDFITKSGEDIDLEMPILDENNWNMYLDYNDLNNLLIINKIMNNYNETIAKYYKEKFEGLIINENSQNNLDQLKSQNDQNRLDKYKGLVEKIQNDRILVAGVNYYLINKMKL